MILQQELISLNEIFIQNQSYGNEHNPDIFSYFDKGSYVCLTAPHSTKTFVAKHLKGSDLYTGAITKYVAQHYNYSCIVRNKYMPETALISDFILQNRLENHFFLDIHGMKNGNGFDLAVGTGYFKPELYEKQLQFIDNLALKYVINNDNYTGKIGLTGRLEKATRKANVLQLEWSKNYRDIFNSFDNVNNVTVPFIAELSSNIENEIC